MCHKFLLMSIRFVDYKKIVPSLLYSLMNICREKIIGGNKSTSSDIVFTKLNNDESFCIELISKIFLMMLYTHFMSLLKN